MTVYTVGFIFPRNTEEEKEKLQNTENNNNKEKPVKEPSATLVEDEDYKVQEVCNCAGVNFSVKSLSKMDVCYKGIAAALSGTCLACLL